MLVVWPGRAPGLVADGVGCVARAMARWSASPNRRIRIPMRYRNGEWYFELSKR